MHFLEKLTKNPNLDNPSEDHMDVHRHFYKYSRGEFIGPAIKVNKTSTRITIKGSVEYEDLVQEIVVSTVDEDKIKINGVLITGRDISDQIMELGLEWKLSRSTGKTKNYKVKFTDEVTKNQLLDMIKSFRPNSYLLLTFTMNNTCKVSTKKRLPQPSKKKVEDDDINKRIGFCSGVVNNSEKNIQLLTEKILPDFKSELPKKWKKMTITNNYMIDEIEVPKNLKDTRLMRIMAIRKGKLIRTLDVDGELIEKQYNIVA